MNLFLKQIYAKFKFAHEIGHKTFTTKLIITNTIGYQL